MLRPRACRWFELITSRDELAPVLEALARAGAVELQTPESPAPALLGAGAAQALERFHELAKSSHGHWPAAGGGAGRRITDPGATLAARVAQVEAWRRQADPLITELERLDARASKLSEIARLLEADPAAWPEPGLLAAAGRFRIEARIYALSTRSPASALPAQVMQLTLPGTTDREENFVLLVGRRESMAELDPLMTTRQARRIDWPADLGGSVAEASDDVRARRAALAARRADLEQSLQALAQRHELAAARADIERVEWLVRHGTGLAASERLAWVTGWTTATDEEHFCLGLRQQGLHCLVQFPAPPPHSQPPSVLVNPPWARIFEGFARMIGQPGRDEADPSPLLALIAPLLFGFMFGDVGQGALLCIAGLLLRRRLPMLVLLVPGGVMAMLFGLLFGSVFAREDLLPALWLRPLHEPLVVLACALGLGALILLAGLLLDAVQAFWRHEARDWWAHRAGLVLAYVGSLLAAWRPEMLALIPVGAGWTLLASFAQARRGRVPAALGALAHFVEQALQLAVNTISFARVGAFALAHAGLSVAVTGLAEAGGAIGYWIVLGFGNLLILLLEGLVVSIQTTRLLLFEFFVRFLEGRGRRFRPLPPPNVQTMP